MTSNDEQVFPYYRSPSAIRQESFSRRMRGLDEDEVREYLDLLADQVQSTDNERLQMRADNEGLRREAERLEAENARLLAELQDARSRLGELEGAGERVNDQVVELFSQAQLVAEEMVEDLSRDARQRLSQARAQERQIIEEAMQTAERTRREAEAMIARTVPGSVVGMSSHSVPPGEAEHVRSFALQAQAQMQSIMDTFAAQVARLGDSPLTSAEWQVEAPRRSHQDPWNQI